MDGRRGGLISLAVLIGDCCRGGQSTGAKQQQSSKGSAVAELHDEGRCGERLLACCSSTGGRSGPGNLPDRGQRRKGNEGLKTDSQENESGELAPGKNE